MKALSRHILDHHNTRLPKLTFDGNLAIWDGHFRIAENDTDTIKLYDSATRLSQFKKECSGTDRIQIVGKWLWVSVLNQIHHDDNGIGFKSSALTSNRMELNWADGVTDPAKKELIFQMVVRAWVIINRWFIDQREASVMELWNVVDQEMSGQSIDMFETPDLFRRVLELSRDHTLSIISGKALKASEIYNGWVMDGEELYMSYTQKKSPVSYEDEGYIHQLDRRDGHWVITTQMQDALKPLDTTTAEETVTTLANEIRCIFEQTKQVELNHLVINYDRNQNAFIVNFSAAKGAPFEGVGFLSGLLNLLYAVISNYQ